jgi:hypothetical protein
MYSSTRRGYCLKSIVAVTALIIVSSCATRSQYEQETEQRAAIARWSQCIDRYSLATGTSETSFHAFNHSCDGHKRDVLLSFPAHLEDRLEKLLTERALRRTAAQQTDSARYRLDTQLQVVLNKHGPD